jgi:hypothetical protein
VALPGSILGNDYFILSHFGRVIATGDYDAAQHGKNGKSAKKAGLE